jgi:holo-[acyl-carrier protein] synthase
MIFGVGTDILKVERVASVYERFGERFVHHLLMPAELLGFGQTKNPVRFLSMRFAAKEAIVKALGTGFANGMWLRDAGVVHDSRGKPEIIFSPKGQQVCQSFGVGSGHISLSDEAGLIVAVAILMKSPPH